MAERRLPACMFYRRDTDTFLPRQGCHQLLLFCAAPWHLGGTRACARAQRALRLPPLVKSCHHHSHLTCSAPRIDGALAGDIPSWMPHLDELLTDAVRDGDLATVEHLLVAGASVQARDRDDRSALTLAIEKGRGAMTALLLDASADPLAVEPSGLTPLALAAQKGCHATLALLLERTSAGLPAPPHLRLLAPVFGAATQPHTQDLPGPPPSLAAALASLAAFDSALASYLRSAATE